MDAENTPRDRIERVAAAYSDEFLTALGAKFNFDALNPKIAQEIRDIGWRYFADIRIFSDGSRVRNMPILPRIYILRRCASMSRRRKRNFRNCRNSN